VRGDTLIPWDNDIDISFPLSQRSDLKAFVAKWSLTAGDGLAAEDDKSRLTQDSLTVMHPSENYFLDIIFRWNIHEGISESSAQIVGRGRVPRSLLYPRKPLPGRWAFMAPQDPAGYLEKIYGTTWRKPQRNFSFADYSEDGM
jgi:hypothetical protein